MPKKNSDVIYASPNRLINDFRGGLMKGAGYAGNAGRDPGVEVSTGCGYFKKR
jgi:hypothetical protein